MRCRGSEVVGQIGAGSPDARGERSLCRKMKLTASTQWITDTEFKQHTLKRNDVHFSECVHGIPTV